MSDARWIEIDAAISSAVRHFTGEAEIFDTSRPSAGLRAYVTEMAFMHAMQAAHTSLESAFVGILGVFGEEPPSGSQWHADLIRRVAHPVNGRPAVLPQELAKAANETRQFRHVAARADDDFDWERAGRAVAAARLLAGELPAAIGRFRGAVDP